MILSFRDRETERVWAGERSRRLPPWIHAAAYRKLRWLNRAVVGRRLGQFSIRINDQWRICFRWTSRGVEDVEIVDYHA